MPDLLKWLLHRRPLPQHLPFSQAPQDFVASRRAIIQRFERGRAFQISDWRGFPGWKTSQVIVAYLPISEGDYIPGEWEVK